MPSCAALGETSLIRSDWDLKNVWSQVLAHQGKDEKVFFTRRQCGKVGPVFSRTNKKVAFCEKESFLLKIVSCERKCKRFFKF